MSQNRNINQAVGLTSYFITLPPASVFVLAIFLLGFVFGLLLDFGKYAGFGYLDYLYAAFVEGMLLLSIPALLSSLVIKFLVRKLPYRRIVATAFGGELVYAIAYAISVLLAGINPLWAQLVLLIGASLVFVFWYVIARFVFILKYRSILFAMIQLLFYLIFLLSTQILYVTPDPMFDVMVRFYVSAIVLLLSLGLFFIIINAPMKKNLGVSSTDAMSWLFSQWLYHNKDMEKAFEQVGEDAKTLVSLFGFKRQNDTIFFVTPYVHYGPFGNLGGSEFSMLLADELDRKYSSKSFVFHGTVTHDLNPVSSSELNKIVAAIGSMVDDAVYANAKVSISVGSMNECRAQALRVNDCAMIGLSRAPQLTEDINFGLGLSLIFGAEKFVRNAMVVDQHNAETGEITSFEPGSPVGFGYLKAIEDALMQVGQATSAKQAKLETKKPLSIGVAFRHVSSPVVGGAGIKVAVLSSSPAYVVVLIDSNGITPEFRDKIESEVRAVGRTLGMDALVGVYTTDTHQTNMVRGVLNPLKDQSELLSAIVDAFKEAVGDMQPAKFFSEKKWFDISVIGAKQSIELISTINSIVAVSKITLPLILLGGVLLLIAVVVAVLGV